MLLMVFAGGDGKGIKCRGRRGSIINIGDADASVEEAGKEGQLTRMKMSRGRTVR